MVEARIRELADRHLTLKSKIADELKKPHIDALQVSSLKKQKLLLKDEIAALEKAV